jgi:hypothetical protein
VLHQSRTQRIGDDISCHGKDILFLPQRVIVLAVLPERSPLPR